MRGLWPRSAAAAAAGAACQLLVQSAAPPASHSTTASLPPLQVVSLCEKPRDPPLRYIVADTPGQIEIFTWSASGAIVTDAFATSFPTMVRC